MKPLKEIEAVIRTKFEEGIVYIESYELAKELNTHQRQVRKALSNMRKKLITFIPIKTIDAGTYKAYREENVEDQALLEAYVRRNIKAIRTMYFNDVVLFLPIIKDNKLINEIGQIQMAFDEGETHGIQD